MTNNNVIIIKAYNNTNTNEKWLHIKKLKVVKKLTTLCL